MQVKGTAVQSIPLFVRATFGDKGYEKWLQSLSDPVRHTLSMNILDNAWFPLNAGVVEPALKLCKLFYGGSMNGAVEAGRFGAEYGLQRVVKLSIANVSPEFLISRADEILTNYYQPSAIELVNRGPKSATLRITKFETPHPVIEHRIKGWMERALEVSGARIASVHIRQSMTNGAPYTEFVASWE